MTKQVAFSVSMVAVFLMAVSFLSNTMLNRPANAQQVRGRSAQQTVQVADRFEYGRLIFGADNTYNWIAGDEQIRQAVPVRTLLQRLGADRVQRPNFATLLDALGNDGWELVFETGDPEGYGDVLLFKRTVQ